MNKNDLIKIKYSDGLSIPILDESSNLIGKLTVIKKDDVNNEFYIQALTKWRIRYMRYFLTQFSATLERTRIWLLQSVLPSDDKLLFFILDTNNNLIGNFGIANIKKYKCELDNLIRGEKEGHPKLIYFSEIALLKWLFENQFMKHVNLHVFSNNRITLKLHLSVGFKEIARYPLYKINANNGDIRYSVENAGGTAQLASFEYVEMGIDSNSFRSSQLIRKKN